MSLRFGCVNSCEVSSGKQEHAAKTRSGQMFSVHELTGVVSLSTLTA
jgi:hypothetical protein